MSEEQTRQIIVTKNGPYVVTGGVPLAVQTIEANGERESWEWAEGRTFEAKDTYALCRCGKSAHAPYCDGTHARIGFDGTETATRQTFAAQKTVLEGPTLILDDARPFCAAARFCDAVQDTWDSIPKTASPEARARVIHQATRCPSGRLVVRDRATGEVFESALPLSIGVVEDPTRIAAARSGCAAASPSCRRTARPMRSATASRSADAVSQATSHSAMAAMPRPITRTELRE